MIRDVTPEELCGAVDPGEVTLVLGAPSVGKSHHLRTLGQSVEQLPATTALEDELVIVDDLVSAMINRSDQDWTTDEEPSESTALFDHSGGAVLVTRPRSLDWLCQRVPEAGALVERVDSVLVVRTPPSESDDAIDEIRTAVNNRKPPGMRAADRADLVERVTYPSYAFENEQLRERVGTVEETVTPAAFLSLSKHGSETVLFGPDVREVLGEYDGSVEPLGEVARNLVSSIHPRATDGGYDPAALSPATHLAIVLVASSLTADETAWLDSFVRHRPLAGAAEALESTFDLPPGTTEQLRLFASEPMQKRIAELLADQSETAVAEASGAVDELRAAMRAIASSLDDVAMAPDDYGSSTLVGSWHWKGEATLQAATKERAFPDQDGEQQLDDRLAGVDVDEVVDVVDGGLVVLTGPKASGKRRLAAQVATELTSWGMTVRLPDLRQPDHIRVGVDATPDAVVVGTYSAEPAPITGDAGVRALADWVEQGVCDGAILICDNESREQLDTISKRAGCEEVAAWRDRTEFDLCDTIVATADRTSEAVATDLLDAMGWPNNQSPTRRTLDVEGSTDQSTLAAIAGISDADLDAEFVGQVVADAIAVVARTAHPSAAREWLVLVNDLVGDVGLGRSDTDGAIRYRGRVCGRAMAAVGSEQPMADEWVEALAVRALTLTNETATQHGRESVGGDVEPIVTAFTTALTTVIRPEDGSGPNQGALATIDQLLHEIVDQGTIDPESSLYPLCRIYGRTVAGLIEMADDSAQSEAVLAPVMALVEQTAIKYEDSSTAVLLGNVFGSMAGVVAGAATSADTMATWLDAIDAATRESATALQHDEDRVELLHVATVSAVGWVFDHGCPDDRFGPWLESIGERLCQSAMQAAFVDKADDFVVNTYGWAIWNIVHYRDLDRADLLFADCYQLVDTIADSAVANDEWECRASLHAAALAAFARIEENDANGVNSGPYSKGILPLPDSPGFEDWIDRYDTAVTQGVAGDAPTETVEPYLAAVYRGALSTQIREDDKELDAGISPRSATTWFDSLTERIHELAATSDLVSDPVAFLESVYGEAAVDWATEDDANLAGEWLGSLVTSFRSTREGIDGPSKTAWFDAFAETDAAILRAVLTRADVGERTHDRLVQSVLDQIQTAATAAGTLLHPVNYVSTVFGTALALAVEAEPEAVSFTATEVVAAAEERADFEWVGLERADIFERLYAHALAVVGRSHSDHDTVEEWLAVVTDRIEATATQVSPEAPAGFAAGVYTRAYVHAVADRADAWRHRLDSELLAYAAGPHVEDSAEFLEGVYADIVVAGTTKGQSHDEVEACVAAVYESIEQASEDGHLRGGDAVVRTFGRAAKTIRTEHEHPRSTNTYALGLALRTVGDEDLEAAVFDAARNYSSMDDTGE